MQFVTLLTAIRYWLYGMYHLQEGRNASFMMYKKQSPEGFYEKWCS